MWIAILNVVQGVGWAGLACFSLHYLWLLGVWLTHRRVSRPAGRFEALPAVTVQLPIYNERYVVRRLLEAVAALDYPRDRLEIQVLDDSTDDTTPLIAERVEALRGRGYRIQHLRRADRTGFKAGALAEGLAAAAGEFLALFDADFVPPPDFLLRTIHYFADPAVGMVQARWGHLNRADSLLTRAQALMLDGHFLIEQVARSRGGVFFNFNGSAGVWRKRTIAEAGGWQSDTLAEDLDLSYRAQLRGWRFIYAGDVVVPAELPATMASLKAQHRRWAQGSIQTAMKLLPTLLRSYEPLRVKIEACFHFGNWLHYPLGVLAALLILPQLMASRALRIEDGHLWGGLISLVLLATTTAFHLAAQRQVGTLRWGFLLEVPALMAVSVGLALNNTQAIWDALRKQPWSFQRTPKYSGPPAASLPSAYRPPGGAGWWWTEVALGVYLCIALCYAASQAFYSVMPFLLPLSAGFLYSGFSSLATDDSLPSLSGQRPFAPLEPG
jgi:cellulose synthase/poly-beta-1,6-N-acetylglucosamine synthase-like glycosyltransferase